MSQQSEELDRGFDEETCTYVTRKGVRLSLSPIEYKMGLLFEDILNRLLFVNIKDIKKSLDAPQVVQRQVRNNG
jgi:hypothetical protein